jgi:hypothetical protein
MMIRRVNRFMTTGIPADAWWQKEHYLAGRPLDVGAWLCVVEMLFTFRVMVCTPPPFGGVQEFYCYPSLADAMACFDTWEGVGMNPVEGWTRHHAP